MYHRNTVCKFTLLRIFKLNFRVNVGMGELSDYSQLIDRNINFIKSLSKSNESNLSSAVSCFIATYIKVGIAGNAGYSTQSRNLLGYPAMHVLLKNGFINLDSQQIFNLFRRLYYLFLNAGKVRSTIFTLCGENSMADATRLNYIAAGRYGSRLNCTIFDEIKCSGDLRTGVKLANFISADILFIVDHGISRRRLAALNNCKMFIAGVSYSYDILYYFDIFIPINAASAEIQYYFIEFASNAIFSGIRLGSKERAFSKYNAIFK